MKNLKLFFAVSLVLFLSALVAFTPPAGDKYPYGKRKAVTLTCADTVDVAPGNLTLTWATIALDTSAVFNVDVGNSIIGDMLVIEARADSTTRAVTFGTNITAPADSVVATKTKVFQFLYNGTAFVGVAEMQIN